MPADEDLAYWRFLKLTRRSIVASWCLTDQTLSMAAIPADPLIFEAFTTKHAGHELQMITDVIDRMSRPKPRPG